jgi:hypothetical protein
MSEITLDAVYQRLKGEFNNQSIDIKYRDKDSVHNNMGEEHIDVTDGAYISLVITKNDHHKFVVEGSQDGNSDISREFEFLDDLVKFFSDEVLF